MAATILASCGKAPVEETAEETTTTEETTTVSETTVAATPTPRPTLTPTPRPTATPTESSAPAETTVREEEVFEQAEYFDGLITTEHYDMSENYSFPYINIDSDEIRELNETILEDAYHPFFIDSNGELRYSVISYAAYTYYDGVYSLVVEYNEYGDGFFKAYTFNSDGHVLSSSEILELVGISEDDFYDSVADATEIYLNENWTFDGIAPVIDHEVNPEWAEMPTWAGFDTLIEENFSTDTINEDMLMFIDGDGELCVDQMFMACADGHDCETFISVPYGQRVSIKEDIRAGWN